METARLLAERDRVRLTPEELRENEEALRCVVLTLWQTHILGTTRLTVGDEIENGLPYFRYTFLHEGPNWGRRNFSDSRVGRCASVAGRERRKSCTDPIYPTSRARNGTCTFACITRSANPRSKNRSRSARGSSSAARPTPDTAHRVRCTTRSRLRLPPTLGSRVRRAARALVD